MLALITGASSGMGKDFALKLAHLNYDIVLVARSKEKLVQLSKQIKTKTYIEVCDLSKEENVRKLYNKYAKKVDLLINNAGFGSCGEFYNENLDVQLNMIDLNIKALHILTRLFLEDFVARDKGTILNVSSSASFQSGPLMAVYYATKSYVTNLTLSIYEELRRKKSNVKIHALCPGPVETNFNKRANVSFAIKSISSTKVVSYTLKKMNKNKTIIIPSLYMKIGVFANRLFSRKFICKIVYKIQRKKIERGEK